MRDRTFLSRTRLRAGAFVAIAVALVASAVAPAAAGGDNHYKQINLVSDQHGTAEKFDPNLVNPWGLSFGPNTPAWVVDATPAVTTLYQGANGTNPVSIVPLVARIPGDEPTGTVFNPTNDFVVHAQGNSGPAPFLFVGHDGVVSGWSPAVPPLNRAHKGVTVPGAEYLGLALAQTNHGNFLYAADFHNARIDVIDHAFNKLNTPNAFVDPNLPAGYAPFNVQNLRGRIYVAYAKQDAAAQDEVAGAGFGFVDMYTTEGTLIKRIASHGALNAPWGLEIAPHNFGQFSDALLVGNFGDGRISAYDRLNGGFLGQLHDVNGHVLSINGLWALKVGNGVIGKKTSVVFTAGTDDEAHGTFGLIETP
ncbi:MAG: hypothetical protein QOI55_1050 [Actinomycetota bacterium]|nr:hypothetical protein [Actinomycetota bacterium]